MSARALFVLLTALAACGDTAAPRPATPPPVASLPAGLAPAGFLLGAWTSPTVSERWSFAGSSLVGVGFTVEGGRTRAFEAMFVQDRAGALRFTAMPGGKRAVAFLQRSRAENRLTFENLAHDFPKRVLYRREGDALAARIEDDAKGFDFAYRSAAPDPAPALEEADRAFAADTAARGVEGWVAWFDREGVMWRDGRSEGADAIRAAMAKTLADPARRLQWKPTASGFFPARDQGFTAGEWTLANARGAYVTIWRAQPDGSFKVLFDATEPP